MKMDEKTYTQEEFFEELNKPLSFKEKVCFYLYEKPVDFVRNNYHDFRYGIKNLFRFFKVVWQWRHWDSHYELMILKRIFEVKHYIWCNNKLYLPYVGQEDDAKILEEMIKILNDFKESYDDKDVEKFLKIYTEKGFYVAD